MTQPITLDIYLNYPGHCQQAFEFYQQHLDGKITLMNIHTNPPANFPKEWKSPVLHAIIEIGGILIRGADIPYAEPMRSAYLTLRCESPDKADQLYELLSQEGQIFMKMEKTFFATRFAMLRDKFGTSWMILLQEL